MSSPAPILSPFTERCVRSLIGLWRIMIGLIAAIVIAPLLTGFLLGLLSWPTGGLGNHLLSAGLGALLFLYIAVATSLTAIVCIVVPGIILTRWIGAMSPALCVVGGGIVCMFPLTGYSGFTASMLPMDWRLLGVALCGGGVAGWIYWRVAERPHRSV